MAAICITNFQHSSPNLSTQTPVYPKQVIIQVQSFIIKCLSVCRVSFFKGYRKTLHLNNPFHIQKIKYLEILKLHLIWPLMPARPEGHLERSLEAAYKIPCPSTIQAGAVFVCSVMAPPHGVDFGASLALCRHFCEYDITATLKAEKM